MPIQKPDNEDSILCTLPPEQQKEYAELKGKMDKVADKNPGMDTGIFTAHLNFDLESAHEELKVANGSDTPEAKKIKQHQIRQAYGHRFQDAYPTTPRSQNQADIEEAKRNAAAMEKLGQEIYGGGIIPSIAKNFHDNEKGGWQWSRMGGLLAGGAGGFLLGSLISSIAGAGAGWLGFLAIAGFTIVGAMFGGDFVHGLFNPAAPATPGGTSPEKTAPGQQVAQAQGCDPAQAQYTFKPKGTDLVSNPGNTQRIDLVQRGDAPPSLASGRPEMQLDGCYEFTGRQINGFRLRNAAMFTKDGKKQTFGLNNITLVADKDGNIALDSPANLEAFEKIDGQVKAQVEAKMQSLLNENNRQTSTPAAQEKLASFKEISEAAILQPSYIPDAPADAHRPANSQAPSR